MTTSTHVVFIKTITSLLANSTVWVLSVNGAVTVEPHWD